MPTARKQLISLDCTEYYHCMSRCVRRTFLCGKDVISGRNYDYRRQWIEDRLLFLTEVFAIEICAYAVMSNHTHLVLRVDRQRAKTWSFEEVLSRWHKIHKGTLLTRQYVKTVGSRLNQAEMTTLNDTVATYRGRLFDISWFMRELNEPIARMANSEEGTTGHFWDGRFKSQALLDESALVACMAYVDLNPIRAGISSSLIDSKYTSILRRLEYFNKGTQPDALMPLSGGSNFAMRSSLHFDVKSYVTLLEHSGKNKVPGKKGFIGANASNVLDKWGINLFDWQDITAEFETIFGIAVGSEICMQRYKIATGRKRIGKLSPSQMFP